MENKLRVLLLGGGGREHAIAKSLLASPFLQDLKVYPGNGGFDPSIVLPSGSLGWKPEDKERFQDAVKGQYELVIVGPEDPLVSGVADWCKEIRVPCFGPSGYCAQIEGSKDFAKIIMDEAKVPTAKYRTFSLYKPALDYIHSHGVPIVIKADGLAAGKGVTVCTEMSQAEFALQEIFLENKFGESGAKVVIEDLLEGEEASVFAICDGKSYRLLPAAQDHKRAYDGDIGPNTGGMGAYCPAPIATPSIMKQVGDEIVTPILEAFQSRGKPYIGVLYVGLMINSEGKSNVVEFNCRFGDPEIQPLLLLLEDDLLKISYKAALGKLDEIGEIKIAQGSAAIVVLAAEGYPGDYVKNIELNLPGTTPPDLTVYHSGTKVTPEGRILSTGGRILGITAKAETLKESIDKIYAFLNTLPIPSTFYRRDIARRAI